MLLEGNVNILSVVTIFIWLQTKNQGRHFALTEQSTGFAVWLTKIQLAFISCEILHKSPSFESQFP